MVRRRLGIWRRLVVAVLKPSLLVLTRRDWRGLENLPADGGVIIAVNHISQADPLTVAHILYDGGRWPQFLIKHSVFDVPVVGWLLRRCYQIPVRRGSIDAARALDTAVAAIKGSGAVVIYPEGTTTHDPDLWPMRGRTGVARLWRETGAPVLPLVTWGPQAIHDPRTGKLRPRFRTPVTVVIGPPIDLSAYVGTPDTNGATHEIAETIMLRLRDMLAEVRGESAPPLWTPSRDGA